MRTTGGLLLLTSALASACAPRRRAAPDGEAALRAAIGAYRDALNAADSGAFFGHFADDVEIIPPGAPPVRGSAAARDLFRPLFTEVTPALAPFTNEELTVSGDLAVQRYSYRLTTTPKRGGAATTEAGSGLHVWKRDAAGRWRVAKDIWALPGA